MGKARKDMSAPERELATMKTCHKMLTGLPSDARERVMGWLVSSVSSEQPGLDPRQTSLLE